jgi:hypothetical protein
LLATIESAFAVRETRLLHVVDVEVADAPVAYFSLPLERVECGQRLVEGHRAAPGSPSVEVLSDPERRAQYDTAHQQFWRERWKTIDGSNGDVDVRGEQIVRLTSLELLYSRRRTEPRQPAMSVLDIEAPVGRPCEHLDFSIWHLTQKRFVVRGDDSGLTITAAGVEYLENNIDGVAPTRLLRAQND